MKFPQKSKLMILMLGVGMLLAAATGVSLAGLEMVNPVYLPITFNDLIKGFTNPGFEYGAVGWVVQSNQGGDVVTTEAAHTGQWSAGLGNGASDRMTSISQQIKVLEEAYLIQYFQRVDFPGACPSEMQLMFLVNNQPYKHYICNEIDKGQWVIQDIYLSPEYRGREVEFKLQFQSEAGQDINLYVDDFTLDIP